MSTTTGDLSPAHASILFPTTSRSSARLAREETIVQGKEEESPKRLGTKLDPDNTPTPPTWWQSYLYHGNAVEIYAKF